MKKLKKKNKMFRNSSISGGSYSQLAACFSIVGAFRCMSILSLYKHNVLQFHSVWSKLEFQEFSWFIKKDGYRFLICSLHLHLKFHQDFLSYKSNPIHYFPRLIKKVMNCNLKCSLHINLNKLYVIKICLTISQSNPVFTRTHQEN